MLQPQLSIDRLDTVSDDLWSNYFSPKQLNVVTPDNGQIDFRYLMLVNCSATNTKSSASAQIAFFQLILRWHWIDCSHCRMIPNATSPFTPGVLNKAINWPGWLWLKNPPNTCLATVGKESQRTASQYFKITVWCLSFLKKKSTKEQKCFHPPLLRGWHFRRHEEGYYLYLPRQVKLAHQ